MSIEKNKKDLTKILSIADTIHDFIPKDIINIININFKDLTKLTTNQIQTKRIKNLQELNPDNNYYKAIKDLLIDYISLNNMEEFKENNNRKYNIKNTNIIKKINNIILNKNSNIFNEIIEYNNFESNILEDIIKLKNYEEDRYSLLNTNLILGKKFKIFIDNANVSFIINDNNITKKNITNKELINISTIFNAAKGRHNISRKIQDNINYSVSKENNELLFLKEINVNNNQLKFITDNEQESIFNERNTGRVIETNTYINIKAKAYYGKPAFARIIYYIKTELLKTDNSNNLNIFGKNINALTIKFSINTMSNKDYYNFLHLKIQELLKIEIITTHTSVQNVDKKIKLTPLEYIFALFDIKRAMDLLQIKLCKAVNSQLDKKCYYLSNDKLSLAFSLLDDCPTIDSRFKEINNFYINYIKNNNNQIGIQETKQSSRKNNIQQVGGSLLQQSKQNLLRFEKLKTNNKIIINETPNILNSKII
jgi:hypothetical protein